MNPDQLKVGAFYNFNHRTAGNFFAKFKGIKGENIEVDVLTATGSGQERLANAVIYLSPDGMSVQKRPIPWQHRGLAPSKLISISAPSTVVQKHWQDKAAASDREYEKMRKLYVENVVGQLNTTVEGMSLAEMRPAYQKLSEVPMDVPKYRPWYLDIRYYLPALVPAGGLAAAVAAKLAGLI